MELKSYFYIPAKYEPQLSAALNQWTATGKKSVCTGVYVKVYRTVTESNTTVTGLNTTGHYTVKRSYRIPNGKRIENYTIIGFTLEGELKTLSPQLYAYLKTFPDVEEFTNINDYQNFIRDISK